MFSNIFHQRLSKYHLRSFCTVCHSNSSVFLSTLLMNTEIVFFKINFSEVLSLHDDQISNSKFHFFSMEARQYCAL